MKPVTLTVRCVAYKEQGQWVAACIDFTLAAQGHTLAVARDRLHEQIAMYVNDAVGVDAEHAEMLLSRRAPLADRIKFGVWRLMSRRPRLRRSAAKLGLAIRRLAYIEPLPLHA